MDRDGSPSSQSASFELDDIAEQPGTYFNPRTEVTVIVDDSGSIDQAVLPTTDEGADWVRVSEEPAIDEQLRDELLEQFDAGARGERDGDGLDPEPEEEDGLDPDEFGDAGDEGDLAPGD